MTLIHLSDIFYQKYGDCAEVLKKQTRPYACLTVHIEGKPFAIPFRHHITHRYAFITYDRRGLDYTKAVVIEDASYILAEGVTIDQRDFDAIKGKDRKIEKGFSDYLKLYKKAIQYSESPFYQNIRRCSALQYFKISK